MLCITTRRNHCKYVMMMRIEKQQRVKATMGGSSVCMLLYSITLMLVLYGQTVDGKRKSPRVEVEDPSKSDLLVERDIFLVSLAPSEVPSLLPSSTPSFSPSKLASSYPSTQPSSLPSRYPTPIPSINPTLLPSSNPTFHPSLNPSANPTLSPSLNPTLSPSFDPTSQPSIHPSPLPTALPSSEPSLIPSTFPSSMLSDLPSIEPSGLPSIKSSIEPSQYYSNQPSVKPSKYHSHEPSISPLTLSPSLLFRMGYVPNNTNSTARSYFNYNPLDENYGPGQPRKRSYEYNETKEKMVTLVRERIETSWKLLEVTNITTNTTSIVNTTTTTHVNETINKVMNKTITKSFEYTEYEGNSWTSVKPYEEKQYWKEFNMQRTLRNRCASNPWRKQSPIDLCETHVNTECLEHHQIRNRVS